jgi:chromosome segregation ATPase
MGSDEVPMREKQHFICAAHWAEEDVNTTTTAELPVVAPFDCLPLDGEDHDTTLIVVLIVALVLLVLALILLALLALLLRGERAQHKRDMEEMQGAYERELNHCRAQLKEERLRLQASEATAKEVEGRLGVACKQVHAAVATPWPEPEIIEMEDLRKAASVEGKATGPAFLQAEKVLDAFLKALRAQSEADADLKAKVEDLETQSTNRGAQLALEYAESARARGEAEEVRGRLEGLEAQLAEANGERKALEDAREDLKRQVRDTCTETHAANESARQELHGRIKDLVAQVGNLSVDLKNAQDERDNLASNLKDTRDDRELLRTLLQAAEDKRLLAANAGSLAPSQLQAAEDERARLQQEVASMAQRLENAEKEKAGAEQHLAACTKHIAGLRNAARERAQEQAAEVANLERRLAHQERLVESLTAHNGDADRLVAKLRGEIEQREARLARWHAVGLSSVGQGGPAGGVFEEP